MAPLHRCDRCAGNFPGPLLRIQDELGASWELCPPCIAALNRFLRPQGEES